MTATDLHAADIHAIEGEFNQIRRDLDSLPASPATQNLVTWEAACMKNVASLLDSMEAARTAWEGLASELAEARANADAFAVERAELQGRLATAEAGLARTRESLEAALAEVTAAAGLREQLDAALAGLAAYAGLREKLDAARAELASTHARLAMVEGQRDRAELARLELEGRLGTIEDLLEELREDLTEAHRARDAIAVEAKQWEAAKSSLAKAHARIEELQKESDENMILVCDLRYRLNQEEEQRHDASLQAKVKVKKILTKVHEDLDAAGAPKGEEISYGERIRWLHSRIEELEAALRARA